jgi:hypothetical protein
MPLAMGFKCAGCGKRLQKSRKACRVCACESDFARRMTACDVEFGGQNGVFSACRHTPSTRAEACRASANVSILVTRYQRSNPTCCLRLEFGQLIVQRCTSVPGTSDTAKRWIHGHYRKRNSPAHSHGAMLDKPEVERGGGDGPSIRSSELAGSPWEGRVARSAAGTPPESASFCMSCCGGHSPSSGT